MCNDCCCHFSGYHVHGVRLPPEKMTENQRRIYYVTDRMPRELGNQWWAAVTAMGGGKVAQLLQETETFFKEEAAIELSR